MLQFSIYHIVNKKIVNAYIYVCVDTCAFFTYILHVMPLNYYTQFNDIYTLTIKYIRVFLPELTQLKYI
jgi:hypothetical protein